MSAASAVVLIQCSSNFRYGGPKTLGFKTLVLGLIHARSQEL